MTSRQQEEFEELMKQWDNEMEAIAGQPDAVIQDLEKYPHGPQGDEEPDKFDIDRERKKLDYVDRLYERIDKIRQDSKGMFGEYDRMWLRALQMIIDSEPSIEDTEPHPKQYKKGAVDKAVDRPSHYEFAGTTVQKMLEQYLTHDQLVGWFRGNILKYRMRAFKKNNLGSQDIAKADKYQELWDDYVKRNTP